MESASWWRISIARTPESTPFLSHYFPQLTILTSHSKDQFCLFLPFYTRNPTVCFLLGLECFTQMMFLRVILSSWIGPFPCVLVLQVQWTICQLLPGAVYRCFSLIPDLSGHSDRLMVLSVLRPERRHSPFYLSSEWVSTQLKRVEWEVSHIYPNQGQPQTGHPL